MNSEVIELIGRRRRQVILHACLYYRLNANVVSDHEYDRIARELDKLTNEYPEEAKAAPLVKEFEEWGGETTSGFMLPISDPILITKAQRILKIHEEKRRGH
jgi:NAD-dependent DNA ligase